MARHYTGRLINFTTDLVQFRYDQCRHEQVTLHRETGDGRSQFYCSFCGETFTEEVDSRLQKIRILGPMYRRGSTVIAAARKSGYSRQTVGKYFQFFRAWLIAHGHRVMKLDFKCRLCGHAWKGRQSCGASRCPKCKRMHWR